jgi:hypothetical protein
MTAATAACSANPAEALIPDTPERSTSTPSPGLLLVATLDHGLIAPGRSARFDAELKNTSSTPLQISPDGPCNPALLVNLQDGAGRIVWSQPMMMCAPRQSPAPTFLAPGQSVRAGQCFGLDAQAAGCAVIDLPRDTYHLAGSFHALALPQLNFRVAAHTSSGPPVPGSGGATGGSGGGQAPASAPPTIPKPRTP